MNSTKHSKQKQLYVVEQSQAANSSCPDNAITAEVGRDIVFNAKTLDALDVRGCQPVHYDLLVLCAAIEFADRRWKRPSSGWSRAIEVTVPVIDIRQWQKPEILKALRSVLSHVTGDSWQFNFVQARDSSGLSWRQIPLELGKNKRFAIPYSDGLDSRAVSALSNQDNEQGLCVRVANKRQRRKNGDSCFTQIPFKVMNHQSNESSFRSRGFQFAAVTAIAAHLSRVHTIIVPESGQGALGPVLLPLHQIHPDYRNHPVFFRKMESFLQQVLNHQISFEQPRLWSTKGQTLRAFLDLPGKSSWDLTNTRSCWQTRRIVNVGRRKQCGLCAACLLRRLSLHAAGITEDPSTYVIKDFSVGDVNDALAVIPQKADREIMIEYGSVGARYLHQLADMATWTDDRLRVHVLEIAMATNATYEDTLKKLRLLLASHALEWQAFLTAQGEQTFLKNWMDGGRLCPI